MEFSNRIIQARKDKGLSQEALAELVGVSRQAVSKWETGESKPDVDKLMALCSTLELSMDELCLGIQSPHPQSEIPAPTQTVSHPKTALQTFLIGALCFLAGAALSAILIYPWLPAEHGAQASVIASQAVLDSITTFSHHDDGGHWGEGYGQTICISPNAAPEGLQMQLKLEYEKDLLNMNPILIPGVPKDGHFIFDVTSVPYSEPFSVHVIVQLGNATAEHALWRYLVVEPYQMSWSR